MALSGNLDMSYRITPAGGRPGDVTTTPPQEITVDDRTGDPWAVSVTVEGEVPFSGQPSPPRRFDQLGFHDAVITRPNPTATLISGGPNRQFRYVSALTAGTYISRPKIHPDLINVTSNFYAFHQNPSRLYLAVGDTRTLIPLGEYSNLTISGEGDSRIVTFDVPNWERFYKQHDFLRVTATAGGTTVELQEDWWGLATNAGDSGIEIRDEAAVRGALGIGEGEGYDYELQPRGRWSGAELMQSDAILAGTRSHEYQHGQHSHRANFLAMMRALDPQRKIESTVATPGHSVNFNTRISGWCDEILEPYHQLVNEEASREQGEFVALSGVEMADINEDPDTGVFLGAVWDITGDRSMR